MVPNYGLVQGLGVPLQVVGSQFRSLHFDRLLIVLFFNLAKVGGQFLFYSSALLFELFHFTGQSATFTHQVIQS